MDLLRVYHSALGKLVLEHQGTLERFAGDAVMVFFNDPVPIDKPAEHAVRTALAMHEAFVPIGKHWEKRGYDLALGVGIAQGYATLGAIGFEGRWDYAAIGNVTNLAARLCAEAKGGQILLDRKTMAALDGAVRLRPGRPADAQGLLAAGSGLLLQERLTWRRNAERSSSSRAIAAGSGSPRAQGTQGSARAASGDRRDPERDHRSSPSDVQPVFDAIVQSAARLCGASYTVILTASDGTRFTGVRVPASMRVARSPTPSRLSIRSPFDPRKNLSARVMRVETTTIASAGLWKRPPFPSHGCRFPRRRRRSGTFRTAGARR